MDVELELELGHHATKRDEVTPEGLTHDWTVFVRGAKGDNIHFIVEKVVFHLHESYIICKRVIETPPYSLSESGYAGFIMPIDVHFRSTEKPKIVHFKYDLYLESLGNSPVSSIRKEKLTFRNPSDDFRNRLLFSQVAVPIPIQFHSMRENPAKRRRTMCHGVIESFSEVVEWKIADFFSLDVRFLDFIESPRFSVAGCSWYLKLYPKGNISEGSMSAYLQLEDPKTDDKSGKEKSFIFAGHTLNFYLNIGSGKVYSISTKKTSEEGLRDGWHRLPKLKSLQRGMAPTDAVTVACHMEVNFQRMVLEELDTLSSDLKYLLGSDREYDVTLDVQGKEFRAHRTVLSTRSPVFRAMYEHDTAESKSGVLTINDSDPESFGGFLNFLYTGRVENVSFETAFHLYATADKYDVRQLNLLCADYLKQNLTLDTVCDLAVLADLHGDKHLMSSIQDYFNENYLMIFPTSMWKSMLENHLSLADKLLEDMAGEVSMSKCSSKKSTPGAEPSGDPPRSVLQPLPPIRSHFRPKEVNSAKRQRVTGEIGGVAEFAQWRIPDFLSLNVQHGDYICSPRFLLAGYLWYLRVYPEGIEEDGRKVYVFLCTHDGKPITASRTVAIGLVLSYANEFVREQECIFVRGSSNLNMWLMKKEDKCRVLRSGELTITCRVQRRTPVPNSNSGLRMFVDLEGLSSDLKDLLSSERKYDVTLENVQGKEFRAHSIVLSARSPVFRDMFERGTFEARSGIVNVPDCQPEYFQEFLNFVYTGRLELVSFPGALNLYTIADRYGVQRLKWFCAHYLSKNLTADTVCDVVVVADRRGDENLLSAAQDFFNEYFYKIFPTSEWKALLRNNLHLAEKLMKEMSSATLKSN